MRDMTRKECMEFIEYWTWGTLIGVEDNRPYAIELSYGSDGNFIYCGSRPDGRMARCIAANQNIAFKLCESDRNYNTYRAVIIESNAERITGHENILYSVRQIARQRGLNEQAFDHIAAQVADNPASNSLRIPISTYSGIICN
ncbi:MAG: pyridoxamine 5'-phosphate oxidase family protein [Deltaproteobacteria bacterium]|nr:pyridoxamine 5'-phosphate oxidase family protein [Deltaproteobacteria bacterium]